MLDKINIEFLKNNSQFYNKLTKEDKELFNSKAISIKYTKNTSLYFSNIDCNGFITIVSGTLRVFLTSDEGKEITLYKLQKSESCILSASCIFKNIHFNINIDFTEDTDVIVLPSKYLEILSKNNISVNQYILDLTQSRFSDVMWIIQDIVFTSFDKRLIKYLKGFNEKTIKITHENIAQDLGTAREVVSRMLKYFEKEGMVKLSRGAITIINLNT